MKKILAVIFWLFLIQNFGFAASTASCYDLTDTSLLLHMDGADASTTFTDVTGKTINVTNNTQIDTGQSKFGGASGQFDGTDDLLDSATHGDFNIDTGDFTFDAWVRFTDQLTESEMFRIGSTSNLYLTANAIAGRFDVNVVGATKSYTTLATINTWYHIALVRISGVVKFYLDGSQVSTDLAAAGDVAQGALEIGSVPATGIDLNGHLDEYRLTRIGIWDGTFTPPTAAYSECSAGAGGMLLTGVGK